MVGPTRTGRPKGPAMVTNVVSVDVGTECNQVSTGESSHDDLNVSTHFVGDLGEVIPWRCLVGCRGWLRAGGRTSCWHREFRKRIGGGWGTGSRGSWKLRWRRIYQKRELLKGQGLAVLGSGAGDWFTVLGNWAWFATVMCGLLAVLNWGELEQVDRFLPEGQQQKETQTASKAAMKLKFISCVWGCVFWSRIVRFVWVYGD